MKHFVLPLLLVAEPVAATAAECPASLILKVDGILIRDTAAAKRYANCISHPWLPTGDERAAKLANCKQVRPVKPNKRLLKALDWVDHVAASLPGCETNLEIEKK